jgi:transcription antitermination protein NusB
MPQVYKRRIVRERVLQVLYAYEMNKENLDFLEREILIDIPDKTDENFAHNLIDTVLVHYNEFDKMIKQRVNNWEMNRIALIDKILLRIGICELLYFPDIPPKVSINEVIEIAKVFSTAGSGKFINGILDAILSELKNSGNIKKTGRGLFEESIKQSQNISEK